MNMDQKFLTQEDYIRTQNKCTRKNTVRNTRKGMIVDKKKVKNALIASCMLGAIASGVTITAGSNLITTFEQNSAFATECRDFQGNVINPNTHRTADKKGYYYDYLDIAHEIEKDGEISEKKLYYAYSNMGETDANKVIRYLHDATYENIEEFLEQHNYESTKEWHKAEVKKLYLEQSIEKQQEELNEMQNDPQIQTATIQSTTLGGK